MEIRVLRYFLTVARTQNITHAAEILHITQPTLSRQLMQLEAELSVPLFIREKNKIALTEDGVLLRRRAEDIVNLADKTKKEFLHQEDILSGEIHIGGGETSSMHILGRLMKEFRDAHSLVQYQIYSGNSDDVKERLDNGLVDIGLLTEPIDIQKYNYIRLGPKEKWGVLMHKDSLLAKKEYITATDLVDKPLINVKRSMVQNEIASWFGEDYELLTVVATYNLIYNASIMVEEGLGYALCLEKLIHTSPEGFLCFKPLHPILSTGTVLVWRKHQVFTPTVARFIEKIKNALK